MEDRIRFLDLKVPIFVNKKNGQLSISLPKKQMKEMMFKGNQIPKKIDIRLRLEKNVNVSLNTDKK